MNFYYWLEGFLPNNLYFDPTVSSQGHIAFDQNEKYILWRI